MRLDHMTDDERISIHAPRKGERPASAYCVMCPPYFNPRSPQGGATFPPSFFTSAVAVFQSTLPARGSDFGAGGCLHGRPLFQSTLPARGSDIPRANPPYAPLHFNPRSPQGGATILPSPILLFRTISIHAPRKGERQSRRIMYVCTMIFQSTLPARGSDLRISRHVVRIYNFNPRSPQGGATRHSIFSRLHLRISIHAPRKGERQSLYIYAPLACKFQSTLPARGSDVEYGVAKSGYWDFNPRSPQGGATDKAARTKKAAPYFNPRSPQGGATTKSAADTRQRRISIHAPRKGERLDTSTATPLRRTFQSTLPARGSDSGKVHLYAAFPRIC